MGSEEINLRGKFVDIATSYACWKLLICSNCCVIAEIFSPSFRIN